MTNPPAQPKTELGEAILRTLGVGKKASLTGKQLATLLGEKGTRKIRAEIAELHHALYPIIGSNKGYYKAENLNDIIKVREYLLSYVKNLCIDLRDYKYIIKKYDGQISMEFKDGKNENDNSIQQ